MLQNNNQIRQEEVNTVCWNACDTFRGAVDPAEYKNYILVFLFFKYLSDIWKDHYEQYEKQYGSDKELIERKMKRERFVIPKDCTFDDIYRQRKAANIGEIINVALENIEEANKVKLEGVFRNIDFNSESNLGEPKDRNRRLKSLIEDFNDNRLDLRPSRINNEDIIGNAYEFLISRFASDAGKKAGEFYTPREIAILLAKLLNPKAGYRICDPTVGSGSLLIRLAREIGSKNYSLYGQESNGSTWALAKMNMYLHGVDDARIEWGDTLNNPKLIEDDKLMKFDIVVANPPFSLEKWGADSAGSDRHKRFWRGIPPKSKGDFAFISHMIETSVKNNGKVGVITPHGVLFRSASEGKIRKQLIDENLLEAVIGLPANLFYGTSIPTTILIFNRAKKTEDVLFIDASKDYAEGKRQNSLRDEDIEKIVNTYNEFKTIEKYSYRANYKEISEDNDYNLNISRYVDTFEEEEEINIKEVQSEITDIEKSLVSVKQKINGYLKELNLT